jgi:hypothetical protein
MAIELGFDMSDGAGHHRAALHPAPPMDVALAASRPPAVSFITLVKVTVQP